MISTTSAITPSPCTPGISSDKLPCPLLVPGFRVLSEGWKLPGKTNRTPHPSYKTARGSWAMPCSSGPCWGLRITRL